MPQIERIIQFLQTQQAERIVLEEDQLCLLERPDGTRVPTRDRLTRAQIDSLITEVIPDEYRLPYVVGEEVCFRYAAGGSEVQVEIQQIDSRLHLGIARPRPEVAVDGEERAEAAEPCATAVPAGAEKPVEHIHELFQLLHEMEGSDLHLNAKVKPMVRRHGRMCTLQQYAALSPERLKELMWQIVPQRNREEWEQDRDSDFSYSLPGVARFRCNIFETRHGPGGNFRLIPDRVQSVRELNLSQAMVDLCFLSKGLVLVTGPTGCGKSTTLAALVDHINRHRTDHIVTIEDPIEFVHPSIHCMVNQREVHVHTNSFARALRAALREDPDIVLVGEMRDLETVAIAIETAETGHLVFGTLHTTTAASTVDRIIDQFPADQQEQIRVMLSESLKAVIAQTLCRTKEGRRVAAFEILLVDPACANLIREGKTYQLPSMMQIGKGRGCVTMNDSLFAHVKAGRVEPKEAYIKAVDKVGLLGMFEKEGLKVDLTADDPAARL